MEQTSIDEFIKMNEESKDLLKRISDNIYNQMNEGTDYLTSENVGDAKYTNKKLKQICGFIYMLSENEK